MPWIPYFDLNIGIKIGLDRPGYGCKMPYITSIGAKLIYVNEIPVLVILLSHGLFFLFTGRCK
jgi:hypothetical protein